MTRELRAEGDDEAALERLLELVFLQFHYDFRGYSRASLRRRLTSAQARLRCDSLAQLEGRLQRDPQTFHTLLQFLTVPVSELFREASSFAVLRRQIAPVLDTYPFVRCWVAGCSTGEEAYSLAILLAEQGLLERSLIYATDINPESLRVAEAGVYALSRLPTFQLNHRSSGAAGSLESHYVAGYGSLVFSRSLRERIVFCDHCLATDGVFAEVQLVTCRNVMIYFREELKERALGLFGDALCHGGFLGLGLPETLRFTSREHEYRALPERWYQRC